MTFFKDLTSARIFIIGRVALGFLLTVYWFQLFLDRKAVFFITPLPNEVLIASLLGIVGTICSVLLSLGFFRRTVSLINCILLVTFIWMSPFVANVSHGYLSFLLLVLVFTPSGEKWNSSWTFPTHLAWVLWIIGCVSYFDSGIDKLMHPTWRSGDALNQLFHYSLAVRQNFITDFLAATPWLTKSATYSVIALETVYILALPVRRLRLPLWYAMVALHIGIMLTMAIYYISFGMLIYHVFMLARPELLQSRTNISEK